MPSSAAPVDGGSPRWATPLVVVAYVALAVAWTWPYAPNAANALPNGINPTSLPASAGTWALWWVADRATHGFSGWWDAPIFHPQHDSFGYSEPSLPLGLAVAPLFWLGLSPGIAYAAVVLGSMVANGLSGRWLAKVLGAGEVAATVAGAWLLTSSLVWKWLAVMPLVPLFPLALTIGAAVLAAREPTPARGAAVGASLALSWLVCLQYGFFLTLCAPVLLLLATPDRRHLRAVAVAGVVAAALLGPILVPQQRILATGGMERTSDRAEKGGASLSGMWLRAPVPPRLGIPAPYSADKPVHHGGMYPGTLLLGAVALGMWVRRRDREAWVLAGTAAVSFGWSVLPTLQLGGFEPFDVARAVVPGLERIREPRRAAAVAVVLIPVLAAPAATLLRGRWQWGWVALLAVALVNEWPRPMPMQPLPKVDRAWTELLRDEVGDGALVFLPVEDGTPTPEVDRMIVQIEHGRRMANGYSSYYPKSYWAWRKASSPRPQRRLWELLRADEITHVASPAGWMPEEAPVEEVGRVGDQVLYRLAPDR